MVLFGKAFVLRTAALWLFTSLSIAAAHDIPADVTVQAFVKPDGRHLQLLVRAPLAAIRDVRFSAVGPGLSGCRRNFAPLLPDAATVWIAGLIELYEGETRLTKPRVRATQVSLPSDRSFTSYETAATPICRRRS